MTYKDAVGEVMGVINTSIAFLMTIIVMGLIGVAFWYFLLHGQEEEKRKEGRQIIMWGVIVTVILTGLWGIVAFIRSTFYI